MAILHDKIINEAFASMANEYSEDCNLDEIKNDFGHNLNGYFKTLNSLEQNFLADIYSYADYYDLKMLKENFENNPLNNAINSLPHMPSDFHYKLFHSYPQIFDETTPHNLVEHEVEKKFYELNAKVIEKIESSFDLALHNYKTKEYKNPNFLEQLEEAIRNKVNIDDINFKEVLGNDKNSISEEKEFHLNCYLNYKAGMGYHNSINQESFDSDSIIFNEPLFANSAVNTFNAIKDLGYEISMLKDLDESRKQNDDFFVFVYATNKENLNNAVEYMLKKGAYSEIDFSELKHSTQQLFLENKICENNENSNEDTISSNRRKPRR